MAPTSSQFDARLISRLRWFAALAAAVSALAGGLVLIGWAFNVSALTQLLPGQVAMKPLTALALILAGAALWLLRAQGRAGWPGRLAPICAVAVALIGGLTLLEYVLGLDLGFDQLLFRAAVLADGALPVGRPAPATAACLLLLGVALLTLDAKPAWLAPVLTLVAFLIAGLAVLGYAYAAEQLYHVGPYVPIAPHTAVVLVLLALGLLAARPHGPIAAVLTTQQGGSIIARRLLLAVFVIPFGLGWLRLYGQNLGWYDTAFGVALLVISNVVVFASLIYASARLLNQADSKRAAVYAALSESEARLRLLADATPNGLLTVAAAGTIVWANQRAEALFGNGQGQLAGRPIDELVPRLFQGGHLAHRQTFAADPRARAMGAGRDLFGLRQDGTEFPVEIGLSSIETSDGRQTLASVIDITQRKAADAALRQSEERFAKAFRASPAALSVTRLADGRFVDVNDQFLQLLGYERDEVIGHTSTGLNMFPDPAERAEGAVRNHELTLLTKSGENRRVLFSTEEIELEGEAHILATLLDMTEQERATEAIQRLNTDLEQRVTARTAELAANEAELRALFNVLPVGVSVLDREQRIVQSNPALGRILKMSDEGLAQGAYSSRKMIRTDGSPMPPDEYASTRAFAEQRTILNVETGLVTETGETIWINASAAPLPVEGLEVVTVSVDITERKRVEAQLLAANARLRVFVDTNIIGVTRADEHGNLYEANGYYLDLLGYTRADLEAGLLNWRDRTPPEHLAADLRAIAELKLRGVCTPFEKECFRRDGSRAWIYLTIALLPDGTFVSYILDVTERRQAEQALRESQQRFESAFTYGTIGMALVAPDGRWLQVNPVLCTLIGYSEDELLATSFQALTHPHDLEADLAHVRQMLAGAIQTYQMEKRYFHKLGHVVWVLLSVSLVRDAAGQPLYFISQIQDITERKQAEQALVRERDLMQALMDNIPDTIYFKDTASRFTRVNRAQAQFLGLPGPEAAVGKTDLDFQEPAFAQEIFAEEQRLVATGQPLLNRIDFIHTADGQPRWISSTKVPFQQGGRVVGMVGISRDITAVKQAEAQLLASLQEKEVLLKEIHHRVKNNLQVVSSLLRLQADSLDDPKLRALFDDSQRRVRSMALIHEQLYRSQDLAHIDFNDYVNGLINYLRRAYARIVSGLTVRVEIADITLGIDQAMPLGLMVNEIISNSFKHAFPDGAAGAAPGAAAEIWVTAARAPDGSLTLVVGDNGAGLTEQQDLDQPASMGLQLVQSFVAQLQGRFTVQRRPGTVFTITIPERKEPHD